MDFLKNEFMSFPNNVQKITREAGVYFSTNKPSFFFTIFLVVFIFVFIFTIFYFIYDTMMSKFGNVVNVERCGR